MNGERWRGLEWAGIAWDEIGGMEWGGMHGMGEGARGWNGMGGLGWNGMVWTGMGWHGEGWRWGWGVECKRELEWDCGGGDGGVCGSEDGIGTRGGCGSGVGKRLVGRWV